MKELDANMVVKLNPYIRRKRFNRLVRIPSDQLIKLFLETGNEAWLPLITYSALLQGIAVTVIENKVMIYDMKGVLELPVSRPELPKALLEAFSIEKRETQSDSIAGAEVDDGLYNDKKSARFCATTTW